MVVVFNTGVVKVFPVPATVLPKGVVYHVKFPAGGFPTVDAVSCALPFPQMVSLEAKIS